jgi:hypothetical protein
MIVSKHHWLGWLFFTTHSQPNVAHLYAARAMMALSSCRRCFQASSQQQVASNGISVTGEAIKGPD